MKTIFTLLFSFSIVTVFAQRNFVPGKYTTLQGQEIQVHINDQNWDRNPDYIDVKTDLNSLDINRLYVHEIKGFALSTGDIFESYVVDIDVTPSNINLLKPTGESQIEVDTVFLRVLVKGKASLYHLKDKDSKEHFYLKTGHEIPVELIYRSVLVKNGTMAGITKLPIYRGMLNAKLSDCPEVTDKIAKVEFAGSALKEIVKQYNSCFESTETGFETEEAKVLNKFVVAGGLSYHRFTFTGASSEELGDKEYQGANYTVGLSLITVLPRARGKWAVRNDLRYKPFKLENVYEDGNVNQTGSYTKISTTFEMSYVGINTSLQYKILDAGIKPYIGLGMANNFLLSNNSVKDKYRKFYSSEYRELKSPLNEYRSYEQGVFLNAGIDIKRFMVDLMFENGNGFSPYVTLGSHHKTFSVLLSYTIN